MKYTDSKEGSPMNGGNDVARGFPHSKYGAVFPQLLLAYIKVPKELVAKVIMWFSLPAFV
jgi:hypothetical protein